jgi:Phage integrase family
MRPDRITLQSTSPATEHVLARLLCDLPAQWRGDVIGPGIDAWEQRIETGQATRLHLGGLPATIRAELAWMAHWQYQDGCKVAVSEFNVAAAVLCWMAETNRCTMDSVLSMDAETFTRHHRVWFELRHGRLPSIGSASAMRRVLFGYPRHGLIVRVNDRPWWTLDEWVPRCDPRIPLRDREPRRSDSCRPGQAQIPWMADVIKWHLATALQAGTLTWSSVSDHCIDLLMFDRWLSTLDDPAAVFTNLDNTARLAGSFRRWVSDPENRTRSAIKRSASPPTVNQTLRAAADLMAFIADNLDECRRLIGPSPWDHLTDAHPLIWRKQITRTRSAPLLSDEHYVDNHALSQIVASLAVLGADPSETVMVRVGDTERELAGCGDPQTMRMLLLQILTGRRASEICMCYFDCLSAPGAVCVDAAEGEQVARFHYAQTKIDRAPDTILVDAEVVAVIEEQQQAVRARFPDSAPRYLFPRRLGNQYGDKPVNRRTYGKSLLRFSELIHVVDAKGRAIRLSRTHRFRHTRLTQLAELGLPVHVLQRYAGHANPTMSMHYVAQREEHAEQAFLATRKFKADATSVTFSREDHDGMHLFDRADRFLPHGYCLLPPLQTCDKGNACLTCSVFVTDTSHLDTLQRQLDETSALIERTTEQFQKRHGKPMPDDNVWLAQRTAERNALVKLIATMQQHPARACQGAGSSATGSVSIPIDTTSYRNRVS